MTVSAAAPAYPRHPEAGAGLDTLETHRLIQSFDPSDPVSAEYKDQFLRAIARGNFADRCNYEPGHMTS